MLDEKQDLDPRTYTVEVKTSGAPPITRKIALAEGHHETVTIDAGTAKPAAAVEGGRRYLPAGIVFGVGGAGLVVGSVFGALALAQSGDVKSKCGGAPPCMPVPPNTRADLEQQASAAKTKAWVANVGIGVAVAGIATGIALVITALPKAPESVKSAVGPSGITLRF